MYKVVELKASEDLAKKLTEFGRQGWHLVQMTDQKMILKSGPRDPYEWDGNPPESGMW